MIDAGYARPSLLSAAPRRATASQFTPLRSTPTSLSRSTNTGAEHAVNCYSPTRRSQNRTKYAFDNANQLSSITYTKGATTIGDLQYTYNSAGRRTKVTGSLAATELPAGVAAAVYNANNQLTSWGGVTQTYDLNGNVTSDSTSTYSWSVRDQLSGVSGGTTASFAYDGIGRRKSKTVGGTQTGFLYDGLNFVQELSGSTPTANLITGGIDEVFQRKVGSSASGPITDAIGSIIGLTDSAGSLATQYTLAPYGSSTTTGTTSTNTQKYTGREDDGIGMLFYRARYYVASSGRFASEDPLGVVAGSNSYAYVMGNPISFTDPLGLSRAVFNRGTQTITVTFVGGGSVTYPAGNNTINPLGKPNVVDEHGPAPDGTWPVQLPRAVADPDIAPYFWPIGDAGPNGKDRSDIARQRGIGLHGGGSDFNADTRGCIRMNNRDIVDLFRRTKNDPLTIITIGG